MYSDWRLDIWINNGNSNKMCFFLDYTCPIQLSSPECCWKNVRQDINKNNKAQNHHVYQIPKFSTRKGTPEHFSSLVFAQKLILNIL